MTIENGYLADARDLMLSFQMHHLCNLENSSAWSSANINSFNIAFAMTPTTSTNFTSKSNEWYCRTGTGTLIFPSVDLDTTTTTPTGSYFEAEIWKIYDELDDSSIDPTKWDTAVTGTGAVTDGGVSSGFTGTAKLTSKSLTSYKIIKVAFTGNSNSTGGIGSNSFAIRITDGTNSFDLGSGGGGVTTSNSVTGETIIYLDWANKIAYANRDVKDTGVGTGTQTYYYREKVSYNLGVWTDFKVEIYAVANNDNNAFANFSYVRTGSANPSTAPTYYHSIDGGSNYTSSAYHIVTTTATGSAFRSKVVVTPASGEVFTLRSVSYLKVK